LGFHTGEGGTLPDSALILRAYEKWGTDCAQHLEGPFVFALHDLRTRITLLARSASPEANIFYFRRACSVAFSSAPKGLFALPWVPRELDPESVADVLTAVPEPERCFFKSIDRLPAGHALIAERHAVSIRAFRVLDESKRIHYGRDSQYVDHFNDLFHRAVANSLDSTAAPGILMSGGLDSTAIASVAAPLLDAHGSRLAAFTEVPPPRISLKVPDGQYANEEIFVRAMAQMYPNIDLHLAVTPSTFFLENLDTFFSAAECPFGSPANRVWWENFYRLAHDIGVRTLLNGICGNMSISWTGANLLSELMAAGFFGRAYSEARAISTREGRNQPTFRILFSRGISYWLPDRLRATLMAIVLEGRLPSPREPAWHEFSSINPAFAKTTRVGERARERGHSLFRLPPRDPVRYRLQGVNVMEISLDIARGLEAMFGVETRDPTREARLVEFCLTVPEEQFLRNGESRWLLRRAMSGKLPHEILTNRKRGLQASNWYMSLKAASPAVAETVASFRRSELIRNVLDLERLSRLSGELSTASETQIAARGREFRQVLSFGLMMGRFLSWFESGQM
jgi:asparagine synthase (glutamine-hydrolysing)